MYDRLYGRTGLITMLGSGLLWAWYDALFTGALVSGAERSDFMAEMAAVAIFALGGVWIIPLFARTPSIQAFIESRCGIVVSGLTGALGSLAVIGSSALGSYPLFAVGCLLAALFLSCGTLQWGAVYCQGGTITATPYVAGAFAVAFVLDVPLFFMIKGAASFFYALFPLTSMALLMVVPKEDRAYSSVLDESIPRQRPLSGKVHGGLGISLAVAIGYALVMTGFGFFQHLISFSAVASSGAGNYGGAVQAARGAVAVALFALILVNPRNSKRIYRVGLPIMIAGCMIVPFFFGSTLFPFAACVIIAGYTAFDLFMWVTFSSIACTQSSSPVRTIGCMRVVCSLCYTLGALLGMGLIGFDGSSSTVVMQASVSFVGYLIVIAVVLLLSSEEVLALTTGYFDYRNTIETAATQVAGDGEEPVEVDASGWLDARFAELGLSAREAEVAGLIAHGRTQKWIADYLCISENTVGTHLRRIYQKTQVHNRQEFLDVLAQGRSS